LYTDSTESLESLRYAIGAGSKSRVKRTITTAASNPMIPTSGDSPDHIRVELRRVAAPVTGSAVVCVVLVTPRYL
jgi:hypothetical protein